MKTTAIALCLSLICGSTFAQNAASQQQKTDTTLLFGSTRVTLPKVAEPVFRKDTLSIIDFGAVSDGNTLNTKSINDAILQANKRGGGVVLIPRGIWLTGPVELKSNVNLHIASGALLLFTKDFDQYKMVETNWEGLTAVRNQSPISGVDLENIAITGKGVVDGNGDAWRMVKKDKLSEGQWQKLIASGGIVNEEKRTWYPSESSLKGASLKNGGVIAAGKTLNDYQEIKDFLRPNLMVLTRCKKVLIDGPTFQNSAAWNLHPLMCEDVTVRNVIARNPWYAQNGDGIDVESCKNVLIENSVFDVGDDGICIKSGRDEQGRKRGMPTENLIVNNCTVYAAHGGFVIGSEMSGGARNICVSNCTFMGTDIGLRFKTTRGRGGLVENIYVKNITMKDIVGEAILFDMYYAAVDPIKLPGEKRTAPKTELLPVTEATPQFRNFYIENVVCNGAEKAIFVRGLPEMNIKNISLNNITIKAKTGIELIEAQEISLNNLNISTNSANTLTTITNSSNIMFNKLSCNKLITLLFAVEGERSSNICVTNTDTSVAKSVSSFSNGADKKSLKLK
ncbi:glycoside hydrolase [Solitalea longa]|uniref:Glycoside hydrolase n=1 Tax=Solitalea longa TaxID=2079460 RepID=A0A2S5A138_9SPHI|nr:glycoside hydrolase family 28 protein [Solitalea longa]POY35843.1 glycoside hydrolase [Solitalea longa]